MPIPIPPAKVYGRLRRLRDVVVTGRLFDRLQLEAAPLIVGVVQLGKGVGQFHVRREQFVTFGQQRIIFHALRQRRQHDRISVHEGRLDEVRFDDTLEELVQRVGMTERFRDAEIVQQTMARLGIEQLVA